MNAKVTCEKCKELVPDEYTVACDVCKQYREHHDSIACLSCIENYGEKFIQNDISWTNEWICPTCLEDKEPECHGTKRYWQSEEYKCAKKARIDAETRAALVETTKRDIRETLMPEGRKSDLFKKLIVDIFATSAPVKEFMGEAFPQHDAEVFTEAMKHIIAADHFKWDVKTLYPDPNQE